MRTIWTIDEGDVFVVSSGHKDAVKNHYLVKAVKNFTDEEVGHAWSRQDKPMDMREEIMWFVEWFVDRSGFIEKLPPLVLWAGKGPLQEIDFKWIYPPTSPPKTPSEIPAVVVREDKQ